MLVVMGRVMKITIVVLKIMMTVMMVVVMIPVTVILTVAAIAMIRATIMMSLKVMTRPIRSVVITRVLMIVLRVCGNTGDNSTSAH